MEHGLADSPPSTGQRHLEQARAQAFSSLSLWLLLAAIVLGATLLRAWALDVAPLWWDEGNNAYFAHRNVAQMLDAVRATRDADPPAHRLALALWLKLLGDSAFSLRLLSVAFGVATVPLVFRWARWLAGPRAALMAAAATALSPGLVCYGREAKAYSFVTFFGLLALYVWSRYLDRQQRPRPLLWVLYVLAELLALGAHYYAVFLIVAQGVWLAYDLGTGGDHGRSRSRVFRWLVAQVVVGAVLLPWLALTFASAVKGAQGLSQHDALAVLPYIRDVLTSLGAGRGSPAAALAAVLVLGAGVLVEIKGSDRRRVGLLLCAVLVPIGCGFLAQRQLSFFSGRFLLYTAPALYLVAALGLSRLRLAGPILCTGLVAAWLWALPPAYAPALGPEEDLRPLAQTLRAQAQAGDGVLVTYVWQEGILRMRAPGVPVTYHLAGLTPETVDEQMRDLLAQHTRLWLVTYRSPLQHPQNLGGWWLEHHAARSTLTESGHGRLVLYLAPQAESPTALRAVSFEHGITLAYVPQDEAVAAGEPFAVALHWRVDAPVPDSYAVFVHLYNEKGELWTQSDGPPVNGLQPFPQFVPGDTVTDHRALWLAPDTPPGDYALVVGLYDPVSGTRLRLAEGPEAGKDSRLIGKIRVTAEGL